MPWRRLHLVRALSAAGLVSSLMFLGSPHAAATSSDDAEPTTAPSDASTTETVGLLKAAQAGDLKVSARGQGQDKVRLNIQNTSSKRLNVIVPPGLVASSGVGQGGRGGGGFQSMGLGMLTNRPGSFGQFQGSSAAGLRSMPVAGSETSAVTIPAGETLDVSIPAVCLNYGVATPTSRDAFTLMDVDDFTQDVRVRKALRSLALLGTSQGVAQASMWRICNDVPFEEMASRDSKSLNDYEISLASRFVDAVDAGGSEDLVNPALLTEGRVFLRLQAEGAAIQDDASRLGAKLDGLRLLGLPIQVVSGEEPPSANAPALYVKVALSESQAGEAVGRLQVGYTLVDDQWRPLGKATFRDRSSAAVLDAQSLVRLVEQELVATFVTVKPAKRTVNSTTLRVENRLPFTVSGLTVRAGTSAGSPIVPFDAVGIGPARSALLPIQAGQAQIAGVELNGL
ncbi:hypothetical protein [Paludisphaera mucosa]|uniref:Uncharacterized protein n=1 Tax=Paludisphaera mucosa TaxID=3030827 RepID=A0ABT6FFH2_9BACT|nr:hypothetical protein [Paludisphaera mucosa]MDG3006269.1 hypothetical protein [Paludisphaera mucosa]